MKSDLQIIYNLCNGHVASSNKMWIIVNTNGVIIRQFAVSSSILTYVRWCTSRRQLRTSSWSHCWCAWRYFPGHVTASCSIWCRTLKKSPKCRLHMSTVTVRTPPTLTKDVVVCTFVDDLHVHTCSDVMPTRWIAREPIKDFELWSKQCSLWRPELAPQWSVMFLFACKFGLTLERKFSFHTPSPSAPWRR